MRTTKSKEQAHDLVQDVFSKCWTRRDQWHEIDDMGAWLYRVCANHLVDFIRKSAADQRLRQQLWIRIREATNDDASVAIEAREQARQLRLAIGLLPAQRRTIFLLNREEGLSYQEIADEMKLSKHTIKNQLSTALQQLRSAFSPKK